MCERAIDSSKTNVGIVYNHVKLGPAVISCSLFHNWIQQFRSGKKVNPHFIIKHEAIGSTEHLHSRCGKEFGQRSVHNFIRRFFIIIHIGVRNFFVIGDGSLKVVKNLGLVCIQSIRVVTLLSVDVHLNVGKE